MTRGTRLAAVLLLPLLGGAARADVVVLTTGKTHRGVATRADGQVRLNTFGSSAPGMTLGVRTFPSGLVQRIDGDEDEPWFQVRLDGLREATGPETQTELVRLALLAERRGQRRAARGLAEEALARGAVDAPLLRLAGGPEKWSQRRRGDPALDASLATRVGGALLLERAAARRGAFEALVAQDGLRLTATAFERSVRSLGEPVGVLEEVARLWPTPEAREGRFTLFVPPDLHPLEPVPLVLALHGGGVIERADKTRVLGGTGKDMVRLLEDGASRLGWLLLCPTALEAPWDTPRNRVFLEALLEEVGARWNVDLARVHLIGLGEGAEGAWALGLSMGTRWASVSAAGGPEPRTLTSLVSRGVGVWIGHGDADERYPVEPVRKAALRLQEQGADFVYCELPKEGHGITADAERDWYRTVAGRVNPRWSQTGPDASFARPPAAGEVAAYGDPADAHGKALAPDAPLETLWARLEAGGSQAEPAAERLAALKPENVVERTRTLLASRSAPLRARRQAAWLLGELGDRSAGAALGDALRSGSDPALRLEAARALGRLADPLAVEDLRFALQDVWQAHQRGVFPQNRVPLAIYERVARLEGAIVEALARVAKAEDVAPDVEQALVLGLLRDARVVEPRRGPGGDPALARLALIRSIARAYKRLGAEKTLVDMLRSVVKKDPAALQAIADGLREGVPR